VPTLRSADPARARPRAVVVATSSAASFAPVAAARVVAMRAPGVTKRVVRASATTGGAENDADADADDSTTSVVDLEKAAPPPGPATPLEGSALVANVLPAVLVAALGAFSFGFHLGVVNPALEHLARDLGIAADARLKGFVVSAVLAGATIGSTFGGKIADAIGRKRALVASAGPLFVGSLLCSYATNVAAMLIGRALCGVGLGAASNVVPMYIAEISPEKYRGSLGSLNQLLITIGILCAVVAGLPLSGDPAWWRTMFLLGVIPAGLQGALMTVVPESPSWLRRRGKTREAQAAELALWGAVLGASAGEDKGDDGAKEADAPISDLFAAENRRQMTIGTALFFLQQMTGINAVIYFSSAMFVAAGVESAVAASVAVVATNVFGTFVSGQVLDRTGRKPLLYVSFVGMGLSCLCIAYAMAWQSAWALAGPAAVIATLAYIMSFGLGVGPIPGLMSSEIFSSRVRGSAMSACLMTHWVFNFFIGQMFLPVVEAVGAPAVFVGFAGMCAVSVLFVKTTVLETKGKSLDVIQKEMAALNA